jgi:hypothetical protein
MAVDHTPPAAARGALGAVASLLRHRSTQLQNDQLIGAEFICKLPGGALYYESALELDTDGSAFAKLDATGQARTSAHLTDGSFLDANTVNYIVLPEGGFTDRFGIQLGDMAVVIFRDRLAFACFGDFGPSNKLGEASIAVHRDLGFERVVKGRLVNAGIDGEVVTIVFPQSGLIDSAGIHIGVTTDGSETLGLLAFKWLVEAGEDFEKAELDRVSQPRTLTIPADAKALVQLLRPWVQDVVAATPHPRTIDGRNPVDYLLTTAQGLDVLLYAPTAMAGGSPPPRPVKTVYVNFTSDIDADGRWYVRRITFHLDPQAQAAAEKALAAVP